MSFQSREKAHCLASGALWQPHQPGSSPAGLTLCQQCCFNFLAHCLLLGEELTLIDPWISQLVFQVKFKTNVSQLIDEYCSYGN